MFGLKLPFQEHTTIAGMSNSTFYLHRPGWQDLSLTPNLTKITRFGLIDASFNFK